MKPFLTWFLGTVFTIFIWGVINYLTTVNGWLLTPLAEPEKIEEFSGALFSEVEQQYQGNVSALLIKAGRVHDGFNLSKGELVSNDSVFGVASLGKWVAAVGVMTLVEHGKLDLDAPVSDYLTRWQLPPSEFNNEAVTLRLLLSHTAGITDGLGHDGFPPGTPVQNLVEHLTLAKDADPEVSGKVRVEMEPGSQWMYSGGSYNLIQLVMEEVSGMAFEHYMQQAVFQPLGMHNTGYHVNRSSPTVAQYFGEYGELRIYPNYTSLAATGLYSSTNDLAKFVISQMPTSVAGASSLRVLSDASLAIMRQPIAQVKGTNIWGAGPMLFAPNNHDDFILGHGGQSPMLNASARLNPATGNAFIMLQTGNKNALSSEMAGHWTLWETGYPDIFILKNTIPQMVQRMLLGNLFIILLSALLAGVWLFVMKKDTLFAKKEVCPYLNF